MNPTPRAGRTAARAEPLCAGPYELLESLGRGGMGTVYRGRHRATGQPVAVKVMTPELAADPVLLGRFEQEYAAANQLRHPHIVPGLDFGVDGGRPYLVMELVDGWNLREYVRRQGSVPEAEAVRIALQVADGLQLAHARGLIHRDVKPENVLVGKDGRARLTDLGLVKDEGSGRPLTRTGTCLGTVTYMAPEQFEDAKHADARCDVYGLGATLYFALTGVPPFQGRGNLSILKKKLTNDFQPPSQVAPGIRAHVDRAVCRALDADPAGRPASCAELTAMLTEGGPADERDRTRPGSNPAPQAPVDPQPGEERREARRFATDLDASCYPLQGGRRGWPVLVDDISLTGVRMSLDRRFEPGTILRVEVSEDYGGTSSWLLRVRWVREMPGKKWGIGCAFNQALCEEDLTSFVKRGARTVVTLQAEA